MHVRRTILYFIIPYNNNIIITYYTKLARVVIYFFNSDYARGGNREQRIMIHIDIGYLIHVIYCVDIGTEPLKYYFGVI